MNGPAQNRVAVPPPRARAGPGARGRWAAWLVLGALGAAALAFWFFQPRPGADELWTEAENAASAGRWREARAAARRIERLRAPAPEDWFLRGQIASAAGHDNEAIAAFRRVPETAKWFPRAAYSIGLTERKRNRLRPAEAAYRAALERAPALLGARRELIYILGVQGRRRELDAQFKALARHAPLTYSDMFTWCLTHFVSGGPEDVDVLASFIEADPEDRHSRLALARLLIDQPGEEAGSRFARALEGLPADDPEARALRIERKLNSGDLAEALAMLERERSEGPRLARLRGRVALLRGDAAAAVGHFQQALGAEPYDRVSHAALGKALLVRGDREAAQKHLTRAGRLDEVYNLVNRLRNSSRDADRLADALRLARACETAGLDDEARGWFLLAIERDPLNTDAQQALRRLRPQPNDSKGHSAAAIGARAREDATGPQTPTRAGSSPAR